jgi:hypothetical protein
VISFTLQPLNPSGEESPASRGKKGWMGTVQYRKISCPCRESIPGFPVRSSSLYRLSCPGSSSHVALCAFAVILCLKHLFQKWTAKAYFDTADQNVLSVSSYDLVSCILLQSHLEPVSTLKQKFSSFLKNKATTLRSKTKSWSSCELLLLLPEMKTVYHFERRKRYLGRRMYNVYYK